MFHLYVAVQTFLQEIELKCKQKIVSQQRKSIHNSRSPQVSSKAPILSKEFLDSQVTIECGFTLKHIHDMIRKYGQKLTFSQIISMERLKAYISTLL